MVPDAFDNDRWDYLFYFKRGRLNEPEQRQVTVYFEDDKVTRVERPRRQPASAGRKPEPNAEPKE